MKYLLQLLSIAFCVVSWASLTEGDNSSIDDGVWAQYEKCAASFANRTWLCDPENTLGNETAEKLEDLLLKVHTETPCFCDFSEQCYRYSDIPIKSGFVAALLVVDFVTENSTILESTAEAIYDAKSLGSDDCDNGILIIYAVANRSLITYRGIISYMTLSEDEESSIHETTKDMLLMGDSRALQTMIKQYTIKLRGKTRFMDFFWETWVGMIVGSLIVGIVLAILVAICCSAVCGKTARDRSFALEKKADESFYASLYRSEDPIYMISEPADSTSTEQVIITTPGNSRPQSQFFPENKDQMHEVQKTECYLYE